MTSHIYKYIYIYIYLTFYSYAVRSVFLALRCTPNIDDGSEGGAAPRRPRNTGIWWPRPRNLMGSWDISLAVKPDIAGVAGANNPNIQWGRFVCPSCSKWIWISHKKQMGTFEPGKQVDRSSNRFRVEEVNGGRNIIMQQRRKCWKWEEFWKTSSVLSKG